AGAADHGGPVQFPDNPFARVVLPQEVGIAVTVEIAGRDHLPTRPGVADDGVGNDGGPVHLPYGDLTIIVLPQDVRLAVTVEIAAHHDPDSPCNPTIVTSLGHKIPWLPSSGQAS